MQIPENKRLPEGCVSSSTLHGSPSLPLSRSLLHHSEIRAVTTSQIVAGITDTQPTFCFINFLYNILSGQGKFSGWALVNADSAVRDLSLCISGFPSSFLEVNVRYLLIFCVTSYAKGKVPEKISMMDLENILLSERGQRRKTTYCKIPLV